MKRPSIVKWFRHRALSQVDVNICEGAFGRPWVLDGGGLTAPVLRLTGLSVWVPPSADSGSNTPWITYDHRTKKQVLHFTTELQWRDQNFIDGCANRGDKGANLLIRQIFAANCIKMKEIRPKRVASTPSPSLDPPMKFKVERPTTRNHSSTTSLDPLETCPRFVYVYLCNVSPCLCPLALWWHSFHYHPYSDLDHLAGRALTSDWSVNSFEMVVYLFNGWKPLL